MSYSSGVQVGKSFYFQYDCEHCKKHVTGESSVTTFVAGATYRKSTTTATTSRANYNAMVAQGKLRIPALGEALQEAWKNNNFANTELYNNNLLGRSLGLNGQCPHCKKYQHWCVDFVNHNNLGLIDHIAYTGANALKVGAVVALAAIMIVGIVGAKVTFPILFGIVGGITAVIFGVMLFFQLRKNSVLAREKKELQHLEKTLPTFVKWGNNWDNAVRLTVV